MQNLVKYGIKALEPIQGFPQNINTSTVGLNNGARHIPHPLPPQNQPWNYFLDQNPWSGVALDQGNTTASSHQPLPLPPDPTSSTWKGRCYNCLQFGHDQNTCPCPDRVCAICWKKGHEARACDQSMLAKSQHFDPFEPRDNLGESLLPTNRPQTAMVFLPETRQMQNERYELNGAIIVDARLMPDHHYYTVQSNLMAACKAEVPFALTHMEGFLYLVLLPLSVERHRFLNQHGKDIQKFGLVAYSWTPGVNAYPLKLKYKCWIELRRLSPQAWNLDHIIPAVSSFGVVLDHGPLTNLRSLERLMVVVGLPDLATIPRLIVLWVRGMARNLQVIVRGWIEEPSPFTQQPDTTPDQSVFDEIKRAQKEAIEAFNKKQQQKEMVPIEFNTLLDVWGKMPSGPKRDEIERSLRQSPCFAVWEKEGLLPGNGEGEKTMEVSNDQATGVQTGSQTALMETQVQHCTKEGSGTAAKNSNFFELTGEPQLESVLEIQPQKNKNITRSTGFMDSPRLNSPQMGQMILQPSENNSPVPEETISPKQASPLPPNKRGPARALLFEAPPINLNPISYTPNPTSPNPNPISPPLNPLPTPTPLPNPPSNPLPLPNPLSANRTSTTPNHSRKGKGKAVTTPSQSCAAQTLRRSARINGKTPQTQFYKKRAKAGKGESSAGVKKAAQVSVSEARVIEALQEENLMAAPLHSDIAADVEAYCGITGPPIQPNREEPVPPLNLAELYEESVMAAFDSEPEEMSEEDDESD